MKSEGVVVTDFAEPSALTDAEGIEADRSWQSQPMQATTSVVWDMAATANNLPPSPLCLPYAQLLHPWQAQVAGARRGSRDQSVAVAPAKQSPGRHDPSDSDAEADAHVTSAAAVDAHPPPPHPPLSRPSTASSSSASKKRQLSKQRSVASVRSDDPQSPVVSGGATSPASATTDLDALLDVIDRLPSQNASQSSRPKTGDSLGSHPFSHSGRSSSGSARPSTAEPAVRCLFVRC